MSTTVLLPLGFILVWVLTSLSKQPMVLDAGSPSALLHPAEHGSGPLGNGLCLSCCPAGRRVNKGEPRRQRGISGRGEHALWKQSVAVCPE